MTAHNSGKLQWNVLLDNIHFNEEMKKYVLDNPKALGFFSSQLFNLIKEFAQTPQKKPSSNPLFHTYSDEQINLVNTIKETLSDSGYDLEHHLAKGLIYGNTPAVLGFVPLLTKAYVILNLFVLDFYSNIDLIDIKYSRIGLPGGLGYDFCCDDNDLPQFYEKEFNKIKIYLNQIILSNHIKKNKSTGCVCHFCTIDSNVQSEKYYQTQLTKEQVQMIKNFCAMLFKSLYLIYHDYPYELDVIITVVSGLFGTS